MAGDTVMLPQISALIAVEHGCWRAHLLAVTAHSTGAWTTQTWVGAELVIHRGDLRHCGMIFMAHDEPRSIFTCRQLVSLRLPLTRQWECWMPCSGVSGGRWENFYSPNDLRRRRKARAGSLHGGL